MVQSMAKERGGIMGGMDERYCVDNGAMIAHTGYLQFLSGEQTDMKDTWVT